MFKNQKFKTLIEDIKFCNEYIIKTKSLKLSLYTAIIYVVFTIFCFIFVPFIIPLEKTVIANDYRIFYQSAKIIVTNPKQLYSASGYNMPFRYLPLFSILFIPYTFIPFEVGFIIHTVLMGFFHIVSFYIILILTKKWFNINFNSKIKRDLLYLSLMAPLQVVLLLIGQVTGIFIFLILLVILVLENEKVRRYNIKYPYFIIGILVGISLSYKPFAFLLLPLLLNISISIKKKRGQIAGKQMLFASIGFVIAFSLNLIYWISFPNLIVDFIEINYSSQLLDYPSTSITRLFSIILSVNSIPISEFTIVVVLTLILYSLIFIIFIAFPIKVKNYPIFLGMGILITMIIFTDSWFLNFLIWFMITLPGLLKLEEELKIIVSDKSKKKLNQTFYIIYKLSQYGILFFTIGIVISFTILPFDPILPFILIILYILIYWRLVLFLRNYHQKKINYKNKEIN